MKSRSQYHEQVGSNQIILIPFEDYGKFCPTPRFYPRRAAHVANFVLNYLLAIEFSSFLILGALLYLAYYLFLNLKAFTPSNYKIQW